MGGIAMKDKIKIVLADDNKDFCQVLKEYLSNEDDIEILGIAKDGVEATFRRIRRYRKTKCYEFR